MKKLFSRTLILGALVGCMATAAWAGNVEVGPGDMTENTKSVDVICAGEGYHLVSDEFGVVQDTLFDKNGNVVEEHRHTSYGDTVKQYAYDAKGRVIRETVDGEVIFKWNYDAEGRVTCVKEYSIDNYVWYYNYEYSDKMITVRASAAQNGETPEGEGSIDEYSLDDNGNVVQYLRKVRANDGFVTTVIASYQYDSRGNVIKSELLNGQDMTVLETVTYEYENDLCTKRTSVNSYMGESAYTYEYDSHGNMLKATTDQGSSYEYEYVQIPGPAASKFSDVQKVAQYYYDPVIWATDKKITDGTGDGNFTPGGNCTRAQMVTFLWRAAGSPEPKNAENPFEDVSNNTWYTKAVQWAVENGITTGASDTKFDPNGKCTRAQIVTFLWRAAGQQQPETDGNPFEDVASDAYYKNAVLWAVENGITTGTAATRFAPKGICTRGQGVTFLYRAADLLG